MLGMLNMIQRPHELNKGSIAVQPILVASGLGAEGSEMLSSLLAAAPPEQQKHILGEHLYPLVGRHQVQLFLISLLLFVNVFQS